LQAKHPKPLEPVEEGEQEDTPFQKKLHQLIAAFDANPVQLLAYCHELKQYLQARLPSLYKHCAICDAAIDFYTSAPGICESHLCMFARSNLNLWSSASISGIGSSMQLLCWTVAKDAVCSTQADICLEPRPVLLDEQGTALSLDVNDNTTLQAAIADASSPAMALASPNTLCRSFARWALFAHRSHLVQVPELFGSQMTFQVKMVLMPLSG
jgi:hypothetical protein